MRLPSPYDLVPVTIGNFIHVVRNWNLGMETSGMSILVNYSLADHDNNATPLLMWLRTGDCQTAAHDPTIGTNDYRMNRRILRDMEFTQTCSRDGAAVLPDENHESN